MAMALALAVQGQRSILLDDRAGILVALGLSLALSHISQQNAGLVPALSWHYLRSTLTLDF